MSDTLTIGVWYFPDSSAPGRGAVIGASKTLHQGLVLVNVITMQCRVGINRIVITNSYPVTAG